MLKRTHWSLMVPASAHASAIVDFVNSTLPTATPWLLFANDNTTVTQLDEAIHCASGGELLLGAYLQHRKQLLCASAKLPTSQALSSAPSVRPIAISAVAGVVASLRCLVEARPDCLPQWRQLYALSPPLRPSDAPGASPCCGWTDSGPTVNAEPVPLWTPHAVVHYGGYESGDLERFLLQDILSGVPRLEDMGVDDASSASAVVGGKREPIYVRRSARHHTNELHARGCRFLDPDLAELSLIVTPADGTPVVRQRTFLSFASPSITLTELCRERDAVRRQTLRTAFGYSFTTLKAGLPFPLLLAASALQKWHAESTAPALRCVAPFWVSAVAHRWSACPSDAHLVAAQSFLKANGDKVSSDETAPDALHTCCSAEGSSRPLGGAELRLLAGVIAVSTALDMRRMSATEWHNTYATNFFLTQESFAACPEVARLRLTRAQWTDSSVHTLYTRCRRDH